MKKYVMLVVLIVCLTACSTNRLIPPSKGEESAGQTVTIYSARHYEVDAKLYNLFEEQTGITVKEVKGTPEELIERMKLEGEQSSADLFISVDGGIMDIAKQEGILQQLDSEQLLENVPAQWRDGDGYWVGLASRARVIVYAKDRVKAAELSTYENLVDAKWKGRILVRSSTSLYNQSLLASLMELDGKQLGQDWAAGIVNNMARTPTGGDIDQAEAVMNGIGDIAIMNTYYVGQLMSSKDSVVADKAEKLGVFFPNQSTTGTHVNVSGIGLAKYSPNKKNAVQLIEFLTGEVSQSILTQSSYEYPVNANVQLPALLQSWGMFKMQSVSYEAIANQRKDAVQIFEAVGWDSPK